MIKSSWELLSLVKRSLVCRRRGRAGPTRKQDGVAAPPAGRAGAEDSPGRGRRRGCREAGPAPTDHGGLTTGRPPGWPRRGREAPLAAGGPLRPGVRAAWGASPAASVTATRGAELSLAEATERGAELGSRAPAPAAPAQAPAAPGALSPAAASASSRPPPPPSPRGQGWGPGWRPAAGKDGPLLPRPFQWLGE